ncbi:MAG: AraC-like DNA-binding protein, partial [Bradymonadia bacterium]
AIGIDVQTRQVEMSYRLLARHPVHPASIDFVLGYLMYRVRELSGRLLMPIAVDLPQLEPANPAPYHALFGKRIRWGQPVVRVCFTPTQWQTSLQAPDPELARLMRDMVEREMAQLPSGDDICALVKTEILRAGGGPSPSLDEVARLLGITARTVQRRLKEADTTFRALSKTVRMDRAADLVQAGQLSLAEIAFEVGFSEPSTFCRAFRKAFGQTPTEYRSDQAPDA